MRNDTSDFESHFADDYLYFSEVINPPEKSDREAEAIWKLLSLRNGSSVLDIGCGYGRLTNRLAEKGGRLTGLDISPVLLQKAESDAASTHVNVEYVLGDMRSLPWQNRFDAAFMWYTSFGYFSDADNERVLQGAHSALRKGGLLSIDQDNRLHLQRDSSPFVVQRDGDLRIHLINDDALTDRRNLERIVVRNGCVSRSQISIRYYGFVDYVCLLRRTGFETVEAYGQDGGMFKSDGPRLVVVARK